MEKDWQRKKYKELRFEYYVAGRNLWFSDMMSVGAVLLGYSVEFHFKQALIEHDTKFEKDRRVSSLHNLPALNVHNMMVHYHVLLL
jgi:hypothetical protein